MTQLTERQSGSSNALPLPWIDRLFLRFGAMYGKHWIDLWNDVPMESVKAVWAEDLAGVTADQIRKALDHCKVGQKFPPTCPEFVAMCRQFRATPDVAGYLAPPKGDGMAANVQAEVDRVMRREPGEKRDPKDWARRILAEPSKFPSISRQFAEEALGLRPEAA